MPRFSALHIATCAGFVLTACLSEEPTGPNRSAQVSLASTGLLPIDLGTLNGGSTAALGINRSGQIVGSSGGRAFYWQAGVMTDIGSGAATDINDVGQIVGTMPFESDLSRAFLWQNGARQVLGLPHGYDDECWASRVNLKSQVVGTCDQSDIDASPSQTPTLWLNGLSSDLGSLGGGAGSASDINDNGQVVGSSYLSADDQCECDFGEQHAFLREPNGTMRDLGTLGGTRSWATAVNAWSQVVGWSYTIPFSSARHAFLWEGGRLRDLGIEGYASDINDNGQVVGYINILGQAGYTAFVWYNGVTTALGSLDGGPARAHAINAGGQVVGESSRADGSSHAVRWTLPPVNFWTARTALPSARRDPAVGVASGLVYAIGGVNSAGTALRTVTAYNPGTNAWSSGVALPAARQAGNGAVAIGSLLYVPGGYDAAGSLSRTLYAFNTTTRTWATKASLPIPSGCGGSAVISGKVYVFTGCTRSSSGATTRVGRLHRYDPSTNTWTALASAPEAHYQPAMGVIGGKLYVAGGIEAGGTVSRRLDVYNPSTNTWATKASMPTARRAAAGAVVGGRLHVVGGLSGGSYLATVEAYDPVTNFWVPRAASLTARAGFGVGVVNGLGYAVGGRNSTSVLAANQRYTP
jgi:probable HAF family extracellular repeat protein